MQLSIGFVLSSFNPTVMKQCLPLSAAGCSSRMVEHSTIQLSAWVTSLITILQGSRTQWGFRFNPSAFLGLEKLVNKQCVIFMHDE